MTESKTSSLPDWAAAGAIADLEKSLTIMEGSLPVIELSQSSFSHGTYRIKKSARYVLTENIRFNPNPSVYNNVTNKLEGPDWMPTAAQIASG